MSRYELKKQTFLTEKLEQDLLAMTKRNTDLQIQVQKLKTRKKKKSVSFADDCGLLLVNDVNLQNNKENLQNEEPVKKLSKVTNVTSEVHKSNEQFFLESTLSNHTTVFGTLVNKNPDIKYSDLKVVYTWGRKDFKTTTPFVLGGDKSERYFFRIQVPRLRNRVKGDENNNLTVRFFILNKGEKMSQLNNGNDFEVLWTGR